MRKMKATLPITDKSSVQRNTGLDRREKNEGRVIQRQW